MKFRNKFTYANRFGNAERTWIVIGRHGAIHFHVIDLGEKYSKEHRAERYSGGLEIHYRQPPEYMANDAPSHDRCFVLEGPCWHDGTSLYAQERIIPFWQSAPDDHERMFRFLEREYVERFTAEKTP